MRKRPPVRTTSIIICSHGHLVAPDGLAGFGLAAGSLVGGCILGSVLGAGTLGLVALFGLEAWVCAHTESVSDAAMSRSDRFLIFSMIFGFWVFNNMSAVSILSAYGKHLCRGIGPV